MYLLSFFKFEKLNYTYLIYLYPKETENVCIKIEKCRTIKVKHSMYVLTYMSENILAC